VCIRERTIVHADTTRSFHSDAHWLMPLREMPYLDSKNRSPSIILNS
jgi:hypothetical protein